MDDEEDFMEGMKFSDMDVIWENHGHSLCLGNVMAADNLHNIRANSIGAVLTVARGSGVNYKGKGVSVEHKIIEADDDMKFQLNQHFDEAVHWIDEMLRETNVLVHCMAGVSRSATIVIAYLVKKGKLPLKQAIEHTRKKRWIISPNEGFLKQLESYHGGSKK
jgi:hypothetical protein